MYIVIPDIIEEVLDLSRDQHFFWNNDISRIMTPASGDFQILPLFFESVVHLISICYHRTAVSFQEFPRMACIPGLLVFIQYDWV